MRKTTAKALSFDTLHLEGSLFVADLLEKAALGEASKQSAADYAIPRGLRLSDEYGRAFQIASAVWKQHEANKERSEAFAVEFFRDALGYSRIEATESVAVGERRYPITHFVAPGVPLIVAPSTLKLDEGDVHFAIEGTGYRKKSPFQLAQEALNAGDEWSWALVTNGETVRLLRDSPSLARPSYLEFDLGTILREKRFPDFCVLWRLLHASRAGSGPLNTIWEIWRKEGAEQGTRVREGLRNGVTAALLALGGGFLRHESEGNAKLREALDTGLLTKDEYFQELLRLIYRFLFIFTIEERGLIHEHDIGEGVSSDIIAAQQLYARGYAIGRLRDRALRQSGFDRYGDHWEGVKVVFRGLKSGEARLDLPALGGLFGADQCPHLDAAGLANRDLLAAMQSLRWSVAGNARTVVDYKNMGPEELGSVYESLLELVPVVELSARSFGFVGYEGETGSDAGNARKTTGSYYTPDSLVQELIKSSLDPVIEEKLKKRSADADKAILEIAVIDPSCGSGHFLLAAARRLAERLAAIRSADGAVLPADYRHALREVIGRCIYGVDLNPMAVELARTALWLEGYEAGRPLSFLDHHIRCGNSLVGVLDFGVLSTGVSDGAFAALSGDDAEYARKLKKRNSDEKKALAKGQGLLYEAPLEKAEAGLTAFHWKLENIGNDNLDSVERKRAAYRDLLDSPEYLRIRAACDLYTAAFFVPKKAGTVVPTSADVSRAANGQPESPYSPLVNALARQVAEENRLFHWRLEFPEIFSRGGFDCVLGNPPWERIKLQEEEFFASRHQAIADAKNKAERGKLIEALATGNDLDRALYEEFLSARRQAEASSVYAHVKGDEGGRYPLTGVGDVNTYALFAETILDLTGREGRAGFIVPSGIATDDSTKVYFSHISSKGILRALFSFENEDFIFPAVHHSFRFCLIILGKGIDDEKVEFVFFARNTSDLYTPMRRFSLRTDEFELLNPNTRTCPVFRSAQDAEITKKIYTRVPVLIKEARTEGDKDENPWNIKIRRVFDMNKREVLNICAECADADKIPMYEAKMIHQFEHRWATYANGSGTDDEEGSRDVSLAEKANAEFTVRPRYWVKKREVVARIARAPRAIIQAWLSDDESELRKQLCSSMNDDELSVLGSTPFSSKVGFYQAVEVALEKRSPKWLIGWRDITSAHVLRTVIASIVPISGTDFTIRVNLSEIKATNAAVLLGCLNSLIVDFIARQKIGGNHLSDYITNQLPILPPTAYNSDDLSFIVPRVLELTYTARDLGAWAEDIWDALDGEGRRRVMEARYAAAEELKSRPALQKTPYYGPGAEELAEKKFTPFMLSPFPFLPERRARIRAELDAWYARLYGLTRDELRYILDPADVMGEDYPSETFRVLKNNEMREFGEYRTKRMILEIYDTLAEDGRSNRPYLSSLELKSGKVAPKQVESVPLEEMIYPSSEADRAVCAAALAAVEQTNGLSSMEHLDILLLATHPDWCETFLNATEVRTLKNALRSAPAALSFGRDQLIRWKECRGYLEERNAITVNHSAKQQPINVGSQFVAVKIGLPTGVSGVVRCALKALNNIAELRKNLAPAPQSKRNIINILDRHHQQYGLAA